MTDQKITAGTDESDEDTVANVILMAPDLDSTDTHLRQLDITDADLHKVDSTDTELPKPDDGASNLHTLSVTPRASKAAYSLERLEHDLRMLHSKWYAVEQEMSIRDEQISELQSEVEIYTQKYSALEADIAIIAEDKEALACDLASSQTEVDEWKSKGSEFDEIIESREVALDSARKDYETLQENKRLLELDLGEQKDFREIAGQRVEKFEAENVELRIHLQELQDYIDGRKNDWDKQRDQIREYEDTIKGMSGSLESHERIVVDKDEQRATLAREVTELERDLAELQGRHTEREAGYAELKHSLETQSRELGGLNSESRKLHKNIEKLQTKIERRDTTVRSLKDDLEEKSKDSSSLSEQLSGEKATVAELRLNVDGASQRIVELEASQKQRESDSDALAVSIGELRERLSQSEPALNERERRIGELESSLQAAAATEKDLQDEMASTSQRLDETCAKAAEHEIRSSELQVELLEAKSAQSSVENELDAQRELVQVLEREVSDKQENLDVLDRSVDRLSAIGSGIRELDMQIDEHWTKQPAKLLEQSEDLFEQSDEVLLLPETLFADPDALVEHVIVSADKDTEGQIAYPLDQKEMTIGRSRKNNIWINSRYVSRVHARFKIDGANVSIEDAGSTNGIFVNSEQAICRTLSHGDKVQIGKSNFRYLRTPPTDN